MEYSKTYIELRIIGRGNYGIAILVEHIQSQRPFVAKKIDISSMNDKDQKSSLQEAKILSKISHPNIVRFQDSFLESGSLIIIMEYCSKGDFSKLMKAQKQLGMLFPEPQICTWFLQITSAVSYLHSLNILHRDIKCSNIYLTEDGHVKLGDFGIVKVLEHSQAAAQTVVGTPYYMSPELCRNMPYSYSSDIWSLGVVLYELCQLSHPFLGSSLLELIVKIVQEKVPPLPSEFSPELRDLVNKMLIKEQSCRIEMREILRSPALRKYYEESPTERLRRKKLMNADRTASMIADMTQATYRESRSHFIKNRHTNGIDRRDSEPARLMHSDSEGEIPSKSVFVPCIEEEEEFVISNINPLELVEIDSPLPPEDDLTYSMTFNTIKISEESDPDQEYSDDPDQEEYSDDFESEDEDEQPDKSHFAKQLRLHAAEVMGKELFNRVYEAVKNLRELKKTDDVIRDNVEELFGSLEHFHLVDQILYFESNN